MNCLLLAILSLPLLCPAQIAQAEVDRIHRSALLIDSHNDVTSETVKGLAVGPRRVKGHTDIPRLREGGVGAVFFAAYVAADYAKKGQAAHRTLEMIDTIRHDIVNRYPEDFSLALTSGDIVEARRKGKIAALIGIEGGHAIEDSVRLLRTFYSLGVRYMTLTHSNHNNWADSSGEAGSPNNGLSGLGRTVVAEMNRLGMMVDLSHVSDKTFFDVLKVTSAPPFASHSSCRAISNIKRNMSDEMIVALAKKGGVIQINFGCEFLSQASANTSTWTNPALKGKKKDGDMERATLPDVVAHIDHAVKLAGIDAVGIGSDFDGVECTPLGLDDVSKFPALTRALLEKGYTADQIRKIYGENLLRAMRTCERIAGR